MASTALTLAPANGFADATTLSVQGLPAGASATLAPTVVGPGAWGSTLVVTTTGAAAPGSHPFTVTASGGGLTRSVQAATLVVTAADFSVTASPSRLPVTHGGSASTTVVVGASGALAAPVALSTPTLLPVGVRWRGSATRSPPPGRPPCGSPSTSRVRTGTYPVVVTGSSGGRTHTVTVSLLVR